MDKYVNIANQDRLEKIRIELFEIANSYSAAGYGYIAVALRGLSTTLQGILSAITTTDLKR